MIKIPSHHVQLIQKRHLYQQKFNYNLPRDSLIKKINWKKEKGNKRNVIVCANGTTTHSNSSSSSSYPFSPPTVHTPRELQEEDSPRLNALPFVANLPKTHLKVLCSMHCISNPQRPPNHHLPRT